MRLIRVFAILLLGLCGVVVFVGLRLARPVSSVIGPPPAELHASAVMFASLSGAKLHGWMAAGQPGGGVVILMHGVRANRLAMLRRALVLRQNGFGVLLFDFQAHGESLGQHISFGQPEGMDAPRPLLLRGGISRVSASG